MLSCDPVWKVWRCSLLPAPCLFASAWFYLPSYVWTVASASIKKELVCWNFDICDWSSYLLLVILILEILAAWHLKSHEIAVQKRHLKSTDGVFSGSHNSINVSPESCAYRQLLKVICPVQLFKKSMPNLHCFFVFCFIFREKPDHIPVSICRTVLRDSV